MAGKFVIERRDAQDSLVAAIKIGAKEPGLTDLRIVSPGVGHAMAVRRKCKIAIDVAHHHLRRAPQHRHAINIPFALGAESGFAKVDVVAVGREGECAIDGGGWGQNLRVTAGWDVAQPQAA